MTFFDGFRTHQKPLLAFFFVRTSVSGFSRSTESSGHLSGIDERSPKLLLPHRGSSCQQAVCRHTEALRRRTFGARSAGTSLQEDRGLSSATSEQ